MRIERDCIGEMFVPDNVLYGIHSLRAKHNFPITDEKVDHAIIQSYLQIKKAAALANEQAGTLDKEKKYADYVCLQSIIILKRLHCLYCSGDPGRCWYFN